MAKDIVIFGNTDIARLATIPCSEFVPYCDLKSATATKSATAITSAPTITRIGICFFRSV